MKTLRIRQWMIIGMLIVLFVPRLFYEIPNIIDHYILDNSSLTRQQITLDAVIEEVSDTPVLNWHDPVWQESLGKSAESSQLGIILLHSTGREIYRFVPSGVNTTAAYQQIRIVEQGNLLGSALFFVPEQKNAFATLLAFFAGLSAILFIGWQMGRVVVKPLEAMSTAARRIASGDLDFHLPQSTVMEVADVRSAFQAMGISLRESLIRQSEMEEERRFFISSIAHDLRTPLFVLRGYLTRLGRGMADKPEKASKYVEICSKKADQLERLVSDLFSYSQMVFVEQILRSNPVDIGELFSDIVTDYLSVAKEKEKVLLYEAPAERRILQGDAHLLRRAVGNLLDNALHHTPAGGSITVQLHMEQSRIVFMIEDTGPGIPEHILPSIFKAFYRGDDSRNPENGGTGLGLTIARRILRAHNGDLIANNVSRIGGALFTGWMVIGSSEK
ncbi:sensor histidine kinase [Paenibacillus sp. KN14-4R]|uniref:sensor histidine kinase n=1 Tax=Paenibacillus sp. KN14-4R TaxID=3445773 RepID=UPI003F9F0EFF